MISADTLNKIVISNFPSVYLTKSINTDQKQKANLKEILQVNDNIITLTTSGDTTPYLVVFNLQSGQTSFALDIGTPDYPCEFLNINSLLWCKENG